MTIPHSQEKEGQRELLGYLAGLPLTRPRDSFYLQEVGSPWVTPQHLLLGHRLSGVTTVAFTARKALQAYLDYCLFSKAATPARRARADALAEEALTDYYLFQEPLPWMGEEWEQLLQASRTWGMKPRQAAYWQEAGEEVTPVPPLEEWLLISLGEAVAPLTGVVEEAGLLPTLEVAHREGFLRPVGNVLLPVGVAPTAWLE